MAQTSDNPLQKQCKPADRWIDFQICLVLIVGAMTWLTGCNKIDTNAPVIVPGNVETTPSGKTAPATNKSAKAIATKIEAEKIEAGKKTNADSPSKVNQPTQGETSAKEPPRLLKTNTLLMLTYQPDIRASSMLITMRVFMDEEQAKTAKKMALTYDWRFQEILKKRAAILENATDDRDIQSELRATRIETADLIQEIRGRIMKEILTHEQRKKVQERYKKN